MIENDKIFVKEYLKDLNERVSELSFYRNSISRLTCKELANKCGVTSSTISNLTTSSKFSLLYNIANEIYIHYVAYFAYDEDQTKKDYPEECICPRDAYYVLMCLTSYYTDEWLPK